jgi:transcriptional regulator with XRE-family HTH domain
MTAEERNNARVADEVNALRTCHGLTQKELADRIGVWGYAE